MKDYKNMSCAACGVVFDEQSDIVVCPECGAPHHRECWKETGHCACESQHSEQYEWEPERIVINAPESRESEAKEEESKPEEKVICPMCGSETPKSDDYCERCGYYLAHSRDGAYGGEPSGPKIGDLFDFDESFLINDVPAGDVKTFVGNMWMYYLPRFVSMVRKKSSVGFNFTAFLTHGLWFIYRKMYAVGAALIAVILGITAYQSFFYDYFTSTLGSLTESINLFQLMRDYRTVFIGLMIYYVLTFVQYLVLLLCGLFANKMYMNSCTKKIKKINCQAAASNSTAEQFNAALQGEGGGATLIIISVSVCYFVILYVLRSGLLF